MRECVRLVPKNQDTDTWDLRYRLIRFCFCTRTPSKIRDLYESISMPYLFIGTHNFHYCENYEPQKTIFFFIVCTESIRKYVCRVYHQLLQYIAKLRRITIDLCKSRLVTVETPRNHSLPQHQKKIAIVEIYIGIVMNIDFKSH
jgi:hypothetical protein